MLLRIARSFLRFFLLIQPAVACAFSPDPRLLQLVPPGSQIVAGMLNPSNSRQLSSLLLVTRSNGVDHRDFLALTGGDPSRSIHQILFVAASGPGGLLSEHTLLVSGHFDRNAIFRLANDGSVSRKNYRGLAVLELLPFARERGSFNQLRWLAILDERIAIFGSVATVQRELDRWIANTPADPEILERLSRLDQRDDMWCLIPAPSATGMVQNLLDRLDSRLGAMARRGESMEYGIRFGRRVEITASSNSPSQSNWQASEDASDNPMIGLSHFLSQPDRAPADSSGRVVITVSQRKYENWFAEFSNRDFNVVGAFVH